MKKTALIMAGGLGERFWPKSRKGLPKQFLSLTEDTATMLQLTVRRILPIVDLEDIYVVTNESYRQLVHEQLPQLPVQNILCEPIGRDTAPCIGLGAAYIHHKYEDAIMIVLPSDHLIKNTHSYTYTLNEACDIAENGRNLVTLGIVVNYPETSYGYILADLKQKDGSAYKVDRFIKKPTLDDAIEYYTDDGYYWNSGTYIWKLSSIRSCFARFLPKTYEGLLKIETAIGTDREQELLAAAFLDFPSEPIEYSIVSKSPDVYVLPGDFGWDDVGSWEALSRILGTDAMKNCKTGNAILVNSRNCTIAASHKLIAAVGLKDLIIVDTEDATLVAAKDATNDIRLLLEQLRQAGLDEYL